MTEAEYDQAVTTAGVRYLRAYESAPDGSFRDDRDRAYSVYQSQVAALTDRRMATLAGRAV